MSTGKRKRGRTENEIRVDLGPQFFDDVRSSIQAMPQSGRWVLAVVSMGTLLIFFVASSFCRAGLGGVFGMIFTMMILMGFIPVLLLAGGIWYWMRRRFLERAEFDLSASEVRRGDQLDVVYRQPVRMAMMCPGYSLKLVLRETVRYTRGTDVVTEHYDHEVAQIARGGQVLSPGDVLTDSVSFTIPANAMHSFDESNNKLRWYVVSEVLLPKWPHRASGEQEFYVLAEG